MKLILHQRLLNGEIISRREKLGLTQAQLASYIEAPQQYISLLENLGQWTRDLEGTLQRMADFFQVDSDVLFPPWARERLVALPTATLSSHRVPPDMLGYLVNLLPNPSRKEMEASQQQAIDLARRLVSSLEGRDRRIIALRYGLDDEDIHTSCKDIGDILGISGTRVQQLPDKILRLLERRGRILREEEESSD